MKLIITLLGITFILFANAQKVTRKEAVKQKLLTEAANFRIDSVIYYCNPFITNYFEPIEKDYLPAWVQAYMVNNRPDLYANYANIALKFSHSSMIQDSAKIEEFKKQSIESLNQTKLGNRNIPLYGYTLGEIWFTEIEKNVTVASVSVFYKHDSIPMKINLLIDSLSINSTGAQLFVLDNNILKNIGYELYNELNLDNYSYWAFNDFKRIVSIVPTYQRSFLVNRKRIFETVKNTPNGPVVIEKNGNIIGSHP